MYTITMLVAAANSIAAIFDEEKDWKKDMFTKDNVLLEKGKLETIRQVYGGTTMGTGLLETIIAFIPKVAALVTLPVAVITGAGLAVAFYGTMAMVSAAEIDLDNQAATLHM